MRAHGLLFLFICFCGLSVQAETGRLLLVNGGQNPDTNYPEFEQDAIAFHDRFPNLPYIFLNAGGPLDNLTTIREYTGHKEDAFGFRILRRGTVNKNAQAATGENLLTAIREVLKTRDRDVLIFFGGHGGPDRYVLWTTSPDISYGTIRDALAADPYQDRRFVRVFHYECYGGAAVINPNRPDAPTANPQAYLDQYYPRNHCQLGFADEEETATSELDRTLISYKQSRSIDGLYGHHFAENISKWIKANTDRSAGATSSNEAMAKFESLIKEGKGDALRLIESARRRRSSWPRLLHETSPLTLTHLKSKISAEDREGGGIYSTFFLTSDYLVDDVFRLACGLPRPILNMANRVVSYQAWAPLKAKTSAPPACASIIKLDNFIRDEKTKHHNAELRVSHLQSSASFCHQASTVKAAPEAFKAYEKNRERLYQPLKAPGSFESLTTWLDRKAASYAAFSNALIIKESLSSRPFLKDRESAFNDCLRTQSGGRYKTESDLNAAIAIAKKDVFVPSWQTKAYDYDLQKIKRAFVEGWLRTQSLKSADVRLWSDRYQNLKTCENGNL